METAPRAVQPAPRDRVEYPEARDAASLATLDDGRAVAAVVLALAVRVGTTRLIDNLVLGDEPSPLPGGVASTA